MTLQRVPPLTAASQRETSRATGLLRVGKRTFITDDDEDGDDGILYSSDEEMAIRVEDSALNVADRPAMG